MDVPHADTMGLKGMLALWIFGKQYNLVESFFHLEGGV